jgi:hypothetical protein
MINKTQLEQLFYLSQEAKMLKRQIDAINKDVVCDSVKGSAINFPFVEHNIVIMGIESCSRKLTRLRKQYDVKLGEILDCVAELNEEIFKIPDSEMRQIISLRYINNLTWQQVAFSIGEHDESYPRKKCEKYLKVAENSENEAV